MRARLAGGQNGGVNSPEGAAKMTEAHCLAPRTQETADGGAEPIPAPPDVSSSTSAGTSVVSAEPAKRHRRTKAEMGAARTSAASTTPPLVSAPSAEAPAPATATGDSLARIADALERLASAFDDKPEGFSLFERLVITLENATRGQ